MGEPGAAFWCILRTGSGNTLGLPKALTEAGFGAWTPTEVRNTRARRSIPAKEITVPLMPAIVFAPYDSLSDMIRMSRSSMPYLAWDAAARRMVAKGWPHFTILRIGERYARVADRELGGLRAAESVRATIAKKKTFVAGSRVRVMVGLLEGLLGTVVSVHGVYARVQFPDWSETLTIAFHLLESPLASVA